MKLLFISFFIFLLFTAAGQTTREDLSAAFTKLQADKQFAHAALSIYVLETKTGKIIFEKNAQLGMAPASCQKIITSATAFELLGKDFRFKTVLGYDGSISNGVLNGNLIITGYGDPSLGSDRWPQTKPGKLNDAVLSALQKAGINKVNGTVLVDDLRFGLQPMPDGWIWQDMGNYFGAGARGFNWNENQYDVFLKSGATVGSATAVAETRPTGFQAQLINLVTAAEKGSGDNAYLYAAPYSENIFSMGTIPAGENSFRISGAMPDAGNIFAMELAQFLVSKNRMNVSSAKSFSKLLMSKQPLPKTVTSFDTIASPPLDSVNYWFLKKSVNLFGEAFVRAISFEKGKAGNIDAGISLIRDFWSGRGVEGSALKIIDGSGLSPANRLTAHSLVTVLQFTKTKNWFGSFYNALPEMNGMKMKDGYINGVRSYTGYVKSKNGVEYSFAFIVNNFDGSAGTVREKMWRVLDLLKK
ncbi:MAG: D-alanyl-D-alanine carboxypeptidase/D-alanyl-D-alanine-endopeptidase [Ferruginibacter sp.]